MGVGREPVTWMKSRMLRAGAGSDWLRVRVFGFRWVVFGRLRWDLGGKQNSQCSRGYATLDFGCYPRSYTVGLAKGVRKGRVPAYWHTEGVCVRIWNLRDLRPRVQR